MGTKIKAIRLLLLFLFSSLLLSAVAVPSSRTLVNPSKHEPSAQFMLSQEKVGVRLEEGRKKERRLEVELTDYPGTGANTNHDPKNPGNSG